MTGIYWRPRKVSRRALVGVAALALVGWLAVERCRPSRVEPHFGDKMAAARLTQRCFATIKEEKQRRGHAIHPHFDPARSGLIGEAMSPVTSVPGNLASKQTSINPNFAAAVVSMLRSAGVNRGDCVAVGCSGSFPALNTSVYAALETMQLKPIVVSSATGSQFGANAPDFLWIDMEHVLFRRGLVSFRSVAASIGGYEDCGLGMPEEAQRVVLDAIDGNGLETIASTTLTDSIDRRMQIYREAAGGKQIKAYINVGGGAASVGRTVGKKAYRPGLNLTPPAGAAQIDSVITRFAKEGRPIVHLVEVTQLAEQFGLPIAPSSTPEAGAGAVFVQTPYNRWLAATVLATVVLAIRGFVFADLGQRLCRCLRWTQAASRPRALRILPAGASAYEWMI